MRVFHISEEANIKEFVPRIPDREDMDKSKSLVWAIDERRLPNYLAPRDCPRVVYHATENSIQEDITKFFSSSLRYCIAIEHSWYDRMAKTELYLYELDPAEFGSPAQGGGLVSERTEKPLAVTKIDDIFQELFKRNVEVRILNNLWSLGRAVQKSTLNWSLIRMRNAQPE